jgi:hypothetical protein
MSVGEVKKGQRSSFGVLVKRERPSRGCVTGIMLASQVLWKASPAYPVVELLGFIAPSL